MQKQNRKSEMHVLNFILRIINASITAKSNLDGVNWMCPHPVNKSLQIETKNGNVFYTDSFRYNISAVIISVGSTNHH